MWGDFVVDMAVADVVETQEVAAIDQYDRRVEEQYVINQMGQDAVYDQYAQEVAYNQYAREVAYNQELVQHDYQQDIVDQQIRQQYNREAEIVQQQDVANVYVDSQGGYSQRTLVQQQDYNLRQADRIDTEDYREDRYVQREDYREDGYVQREDYREQRQINREEDREVRQDYRTEREVERKDYRVDRREERQEYRDERQLDRSDEREIRQDNRQERRVEREDYRQDRRVDRQENREEKDMFRQEDRIERKEDREVRREDRNYVGEGRRQQRQEGREQRSEDREVNKWGRKEEREENRQDRAVNRWDRKQDREVNRQQRQEGREERRQDREANRWERKQEKEQNREERHQGRQIRGEERKQDRQVRKEDGQVRREERKEGREEKREQGRQEKVSHKQNELRGKYEVQNAQGFQSPLFYHHFFEWKDGIGSLASGQVVIGERSMRLGQVNKMKLMKQAGVNNTRKAKISHLGGDLLFSVQGGGSMNGLPLHYMWFAKVVTEKMQLKGCDLNNSYVPERRFTNLNAASPIIDGILYKQSQYLKTWELRYVAISADGLYSYKDETGGESFTIKRDATTEIWTRFDIHEQMLVVKVHHAGRKTEFGIPIVDFTRPSDSNWLLAFYMLLFPF